MFFYGFQQTFLTAQTGTNTYSIDMHAIAQAANWNGNTIDDIRLNLVGQENAEITVNWFAIRRNSCRSSDTTPTPAFSPGNLRR